MKKFLSILLILLAMFIVMTGCNDNPDNSQSVYAPSTTGKTHTTQPPIQSIYFDSLDEAKEFLMHEPDLSEYRKEWQDKYQEMLIKFKKESYIPYVEIDGGTRLDYIWLIPEGFTEDMGTCGRCSYKEQDFVIFIYFIKAGLENKAKAGVVDYLNSRWTENIKDYKEVSPVFYGQKVDAVFRSFMSGNTIMNQIYFIFNEELFINVQSKATEAEIIDFIEHMAIEKLPLS